MGEKTEATMSVKVLEVEIWGYHIDVCMAWAWELRLTLIT